MTEYCKYVYPSKSRYPILSSFKCIIPFCQPRITREVSSFNFIVLFYCARRQRYKDLYIQCEEEWYLHKVKQGVKYRTISGTSLHDFYWTSELVEKWQSKSYNCKIFFQSTYLKGKSYAALSYPKKSNSSQHAWLIVLRTQNVNLIIMF